MTRRADRLFQIVQILRGRRLTTAADLAERLGVSERTIYRDIRDLSLSGVPVEGEAGVGYQLNAHFDIPPLMFSAHEVEALIAGMRLLKTWGGNTLAEATESAQEKLIAALPYERRVTAEASRIFAPDFGGRDTVRAFFDQIHIAMIRHQVLHIDYIDGQSRRTRRDIQPLGLFFWGQVWLLAAWCERRNDYRCFRLDRCQKIETLERLFAESPERSLNGFLRSVGADGC
ncbi:MAG: YafY family transcriptional regulator [Burkholderiales bacterium]|jgi:predicted DNA-binding transcriptional regulator YafY|nr:YafY family transcriptional regulator [Burkholderiales bacterium]